jgi:eukaryotic-like serine/threonine-protein kinase
LPHPGVVPGLAFSPDGTWLASGNFGDDRLRIWDTATALVRKEIQIPDGLFGMVSISPDGKRVAVTAFDPQRKFHLRICDAGSGELLFSAEGGALGYSPDGRWLAIRAADEKTVLLLDARTHATAARFSGHEKFVYAATFSPDNLSVATCSQDRTVILWQIDSGARRVLRGHTDEVFAAAYHPDGRRLATAGRDRAIWLWDLARGEEVARLQGHASYVWSLAFSPDGTALASGSGDFTVRLWDTAPLEARYRARREAAAVRPDAERLVEQLWKKMKTPEDVAEALRADRALDEPLRHAAFRALLRKTLPAEAAAGKPQGRP